MVSDVILIFPLLSYMSQTQIIKQFSPVYRQNLIILSVFEIFHYLSLGYTLQRLMKAQYFKQYNLNILQYFVYPQTSIYYIPLIIIYVVAVLINLFVFIIAKCQNITVVRLTSREVFIYMNFVIRCLQTFIFAQQQVSLQIGYTPITLVIIVCEAILYTTASLEMDPFQLSNSVVFTNKNQNLTISFILDMVIVTQKQNVSIFFTAFIGILGVSLATAILHKYKFVYGSIYFNMFFCIVSQFYLVATIITAIIVFAFRQVSQSAYILIISLIFAITVIIFLYTQLRERSKQVQKVSKNMQYLETCTKSIRFQVQKKQQKSNNDFFAQGENQIEQTNIDLIVQKELLTEIQQRLREVTHKTLSEFYYEEMSKYILSQHKNLKKSEVKELIQDYQLINIPQKREVQTDPEVLFTKEQINNFFNGLHLQQDDLIMTASALYKLLTIKQYNKLQYRLSTFNFKVKLFSQFNKATQMSDQDLETVMRILKLEIKQKIKICLELASYMSSQNCMYAFQIFELDCFAQEPSVLLIHPPLTSQTQTQKEKLQINYKRQQEDVELQYFNYDSNEEKSYQLLKAEKMNSLLDLSLTLSTFQNKYIQNLNQNQINDNSTYFTEISNDLLEFNAMISNIQVKNISNVALLINTIKICMTSIQSQINDVSNQLSTFSSIKTIEYLHQDLQYLFLSMQSHGSVYLNKSCTTKSYMHSQQIQSQIKQIHYYFEQRLSNIENQFFKNQLEVMKKQGNFFVILKKIENEHQIIKQQVYSLKNFKENQLDIINLIIKFFQSLSLILQHLVQLQYVLLCYNKQNSESTEIVSYQKFFENNFRAIDFLDTDYQISPTNQQTTLISTLRHQEEQNITFGFQKIYQLNMKTLHSLQQLVSHLFLFQFYLYTSYIQNEPNTNVIKSISIKTSDKKFNDMLSSFQTSIKLINQREISSEKLDYYLHLYQYFYQIYFYQVDQSKNNVIEKLLTSYNIYFPSLGYKNDFLRLISEPNSQSFTIAPITIQNQLNSYIRSNLLNNCDILWQSNENTLSKDVNYETYNFFNNLKSNEKIGESDDKINNKEFKLKKMFLQSKEQEVLNVPPQLYVSELENESPYKAINKKSESESDFLLRNIIKANNKIYLSVIVLLAIIYVLSIATLQIIQLSSNFEGYKYKEYQTVGQLQNLNSANSLYQHNQFSQTYIYDEVSNSNLPMASLLQAYGQQYIETYEEYQNSMIQQIGNISADKQTSLIWNNGLQNMLQSGMLAFFDQILSYVTNYSTSQNNSMQRIQGITTIQNNKYSSMPAPQASTYDVNLKNIHQNMQNTNYQTFLQRGIYTLCYIFVFLFFKPFNFSGELSWLYNSDYSKIFYNIAAFQYNKNSDNVVTINTSTPFNSTHIINSANINTIYGTLSEHQQQWNEQRFLILAFIILAIICLALICLIIIKYKSYIISIMNGIFNDIRSQTKKSFLEHFPQSIQQNQHFTDFQISKYHSTLINQMTNTKKILVPDKRTEYKLDQIKVNDQIKETFIPCQKRYCSKNHYYQNQINLKVIGMLIFIIGIPLVYIFNVLSLFQNNTSNDLEIVKYVMNSTSLQYGLEIKQNIFQQSLILETIQKGIYNTQEQLLNCKSTSCNKISQQYNSVASVFKYNDIFTYYSQCMEQLSPRYLLVQNQQNLPQQQILQNCSQLNISLLHNINDQQYEEMYNAAKIDYLKQVAEIQQQFNIINYSNFYNSLNFEESLYYGAQSSQLSAMQQKVEQLIQLCQNYLLNCNDQINFEISSLIKSIKICMLILSFYIQAILIICCWQIVKKIQGQQISQKRTILQFLQIFMFSVASALLILLPTLFLLRQQILVKQYNQKQAFYTNNGLQQKKFDYILQQYINSQYQKYYVIPLQQYKEVQDTTITSRFYSNFSISNINEQQNYGQIALTNKSFISLLESQEGIQYLLQGDYFNNSNYMEYFVILGYDLQQLNFSINNSNVTSLNNVVIAIPYVISIICEVICFLISQFYEEKLNYIAELNSSTLEEKQIIVRPYITIFLKKDNQRYTFLYSNKFIVNDSYSKIISQQFKNVIEQQCKDYIIQLENGMKITNNENQIEKIIQECPDMTSICTNVQEPQDKQSMQVRPATLKIKTTKFSCHQCVQRQIDKMICQNQKSLQKVEQYNYLGNSYVCLPISLILCIVAIIFGLYIGYAGYFYQFQNNVSQESQAFYEITDQYSKALKSYASFNISNQNKCLDSVKYQLLQESNTIQKQLLQQTLTNVDVNSTNIFIQLLKNSMVTEKIINTGNKYSIEVNSDITIRNVWSPIYGFYVFGVAILCIWVFLKFALSQTKQKLQQYDLYASCLLSHYNNSKKQEAKQGVTKYKSGMIK